jgi:alkylation response protein AidB-like acyl-CoA dehydrogenase
VDLRFGEAETALRNELRAFLREQLPGDWVGIWHGPDGPPESARVTAALAERGWLTYYWPEEFGGRAGTVWEQTVIQEELFAHHEPRGAQYMGVNWIGPALMRFGTPEQQSRYLPEIARGEAYWAQLFSEPDAGSDLAGLRTTALLTDGGDFVVNGEKIWTSYANIAQRGFLLCRTDPDAERHAGLSALLIDMDAPGVEVREIPSMIGWHRFHSVHLNDVRVSRDRLLGPLHGGWGVAMAALPFERVGNARYARTTRVLGWVEESHLADAEAGEVDDAMDALALGRMAELLNYRAADQKAKHDQLGWEASAAFAANALYEQEVAGLVERQTGFDCFVAKPDPHALAGGEVESFTVRQAPTVTIQAGTYQVQLSIVGRQGLGLPRAT